MLNPILLLIALMLILLVVLSTARPEVTPDEIRWADSLGYQIENPSIVTYLGLGKMGRLGNQLFELAATIAVAKQNRCRVVFPEQIQELPLYRILDLKLPLRRHIEPDQLLPERTNFDQLVIPADGRIYALEGYRQSIRYIQPIRELLPVIFPLRRSEKRDCIAIHIRRTDCIKTNPIQRFFDPPVNCTLDYYRAAIKRLRQWHGNCPVVVVTDDRPWAQQHLNEIDPTAELSPGGSLADDFFTLTSARYLVVSNSTFSLWAGLLGCADEIVGPSFWVHPENKLARLLDTDRQHFCPDDWLFHHPFTGDPVDHAYHWPDQTPGPAKQLLRSIVMSNRLRW